MSQYRRISADEADTLLLYCANAILLDIRDENSFIECHHPRAIYLDEKELRYLVRKVDKSTPVIIYCYNGYSSRDIATMMSEFGFKQCYSVDGGYSSWRHQIAQKFPMSLRLKGWLSDRRFNLADVNNRFDDQSRTALMIAAKEGRADIVRDLVDAGANPNLTDIKGNNALWYACIGQNIGCVKALLNADVEVDNVNFLGFSAINYTVGMDDIFELLSKHINEDTLAQFSTHFKPNNSITANCAQLSSTHP